MLRVTCPQVDCPRFVPALRDALGALGGVRHIFITHQDDVAESARWAAHFGASRILHQEDVHEDTRDVEHQLAGSGPWTLPPQGPPRAGPADADADADVVLLHTPGHTRGSCCLLFRPAGALFTGDHLAGDESADPKRLTGWPAFCWFSFERQLQSVRELRELPFTHVIPGEGPCTTGGGAAACGLHARHEPWPGLVWSWLD